MAKDTEISVTRWLEVRDEVTETLKQVSPKSEAATRLKMAEALIAAGQIDIAFISTQIDERNRKHEEREAQHRADMEAARAAADAQAKGKTSS